MVETLESHINIFIPKLLDVFKRIKPSIDRGEYMEALALENLGISGYVWSNINSHIERERGINFDSLPENLRNILLNLNTYNEGELFRWGLILEILDGDMYKMLKEFYRKRNEAFHRYLTSDVDYDGLKDPAIYGHSLLKKIIEGSKYLTSNTNKKFLEILG